MADPTQDQVDQVKQVTDNIEATFQSLRKTAASLSALLAVGRATCDEIKAYNLYALAVYNTQRGMLTQIRAAGETSVPELPPYPTLFTWKGVTGDNAWKIDCTGAGMQGSLADALTAAFAPHGSNTRFLSSKEIQIVTSDPNVFSPSSAPSLTELAKQGLGNPYIILIAAIAIVATAIIVVAVTRYLSDNTIQVETTARTKLQAEAFEQYATARANCYTTCMQTGGDAQKCVDTCSKLVDKPNITIDPAQGNMSTLAKIGLATVGAALAAGLYFYWQRGQHAI